MTQDTDKEIGTETKVEGSGVGDGAGGESAGELGAGSGASAEASSLEAEGVAKAAEVSDEASAAQDAGGGEDDGAKGEAKKAEAPREDWRDRRIAKLTARLKAEQEKPQASAAGNEALDPTADFNRRVAAAAAAQVAASTFASACNSAAQKGYAEFGEAEFKDRLNALRGLVDTSVPEEVEKYNQFLTAGLETGELHKIIFELGEDLSEADRLLSLSPIKMAVELAKRVVAPEAPAAPVSKLPKPIRTLNTARGDTGFMDPSDPSKADNLDTAAWMKAREAQVAKAAR